MRHIALIALLSCACGAVAKPTTVEIVSGDTLAAPAGKTLTVSVLVSAGKDAPVADWPVTFEITEGAGALIFQPGFGPFRTTTDHAGIAIATWRVGTSAGVTE